jgi:hypothetical protein
MPYCCNYLTLFKLLVRFKVKKAANKFLSKGAGLFLNPYFLNLFAQLTAVLNSNTTINYIH